MGWHIAARRREFQSTLSLRRATFRRGQLDHHRHFNPRSPCGERPAGQVLTKTADDFNPRSPCGERRHSNHRLRSQNDFNPRSPCGERPKFFARDTTKITNFNPRSPCGERRSLSIRKNGYYKFQSTLSLRRATVGNLSVLIDVGISIHALLAESDPRLPLHPWGISTDFNPRSPCGERRHLL